MKSSLCGYLPSWPRPKRETSNTLNSLDSGNMKEMYGNQPLHQQRKRQLYSQAKSKVSPLLRLDSQGEITNGHHFSDSSVNIKSLKGLGLSSSFDLYSLQDSSPSSNSKSIDITNTCKNSNHIPHPSFQKSNSIPANLRMPAHQSFPPPASSPFSTTRSSSFSCPATDKLSPFSSSPRNLGHVGVFGGNNHNNNCDQQQNSMSSFTFDSSNIMNHSKTNSCDANNSVIKPSCSKVGGDGQESKVKCNTASVKLNVFVGRNDDIDKEKASTSASNCVKSPSLSPAHNSMDSSSSSSSVFCSSSNSVHQSNEDKDLSYILFLRKPTKKRRARNKRRNRRQKQNSDCDSPQTFTPSSCSSPIKSPPSPSQKRVNMDDCPGMSSPVYHNSSPSKGQTPACEKPTSPSSKSCSRFILFASADSDQSDFSDADFDSIVFSDDESSPSRKSGKKRKCKRKQSEKPKSSTTGDASDVESDSEQKNSSLSAMRFTFVGLSVSEDEDNDSVDWGDLSTSPSAAESQFCFEFEFNSGLSLEAIIGQANPTDCPPLSKELRDLNKKWNKVYASASFGEGDIDLSQQHQKVHFACDDNLVTVHIVGDEDRGGEWHRYGLERARFQKKIKDVEAVVAPVLCESHRAKVFERMRETTA